MRARRGRDFRSARASAASVDLPSPWSLNRLVESIGERSGCRILLRALEDLPPEISGLSIRAGEDEDTLVVFYDGRVPVWSQTLIVLHELGHHLLGHARSRGFCPAWEPDPKGNPKGDPSPASRLRMARTSFTDPLEAEAEMFATLVIERVEKLQRAESVDPHLQEIRRSMEPPYRWGKR